MPFAKGGGLGVMAVWQMALICVMQILCITRVTSEKLTSNWVLLPLPAPSYMEPYSSEFPNSLDLEIISFWEMTVSAFEVILPSLRKKLLKTRLLIRVLISLPNRTDQRSQGGDSAYQSLLGFQ